MIRRPSWDDTWRSVARTVARRSLCSMSKAGAVIVTSRNRVVATGYNGPPAGMNLRGECRNWCPRAKTGGGLSYDDCVSSHAEANALMFADRSMMEGGTIYVTRMPCFMCAKMIANSGLTRVVCDITVDDLDREPDRTIRLFTSSQIPVSVVKDARWET